MLLVAKRINHLLKTSNEAQLKLYLSNLHPADIAAGIVRFRPEEIIRILELVGSAKSIEVFAELEPETQKVCLEFADPEGIIHYFQELSPDDQSDLVRALDPQSREKLLALLKSSDRRELMELLRYEEDTAGAEMTTDFFALPGHLTVDQAMSEVKLRSETVETIYTIYIVDEQGRLLGVVSLKDLVLARPEKLLRQIMNPNVISAAVTDDVELVAEKIARYDLIALPVVDAAKTLAGIITVDDVIDIIEEETTEDIYAMGAVGAKVNYLGSGILTISRQRITWLLFLVFAGVMAGVVMELFESTLSAYVPLVFFIPLLTGSGGNAGTQTSTVVIRGLATGELTPRLILQVLWKEFRVGITVGFVLGLLAGARAVILNNDWSLALTVGLTMIVAVTMAKTTGAVLPFLLEKLRLDPALISGPFITSMIDIFCIAIYLGLATVIMGVL